MAQMVGRNLAAPLLFLNLIMYIIVVGFASWNLNHFINGQTNYPGNNNLRRIILIIIMIIKIIMRSLMHGFLSGVAGNGATFYFLIFAILAGVLGVVSKLAGGNHIRSWRSDSLAAAAASATVAWAVTMLAFGSLYHQSGT